jgi:subtilisin family serine protease
MNEQAALALTKRPGVSAVWEVPTARITEVQYGVPDGLDRIDQREKQLNDQYIYTMSTAAANIYIVDTGVDPRAEFGTRLTNINFTSDATGNRDPNDYTDFGLPLNDVWHGTATAVVAAGAQNGVAKWAKIVNVRVLRYDTGTYDDIVAGINWITQQRNARSNEFHVANASFGSMGSGYGPADTAFRASIAAGVAWVFAAGNDAGDACNFFPSKLSSLSGAISVGAMHPLGTADAVTSYSNQGPCVDIYAPSEVEWGDPDTVAGGTSAAAPHVAGVFAIRWAESTTSNAAEIEGLVKGLATTNVLTNIWNTSNNLLLHSRQPKRRSAGS